MLLMNQSQCRRPAGPDYYTGKWNEGWYPGYTDAWGALRGAVGILAVTADAIDQLGRTRRRVTLPASTLLLANRQPEGHLLATMLHFDEPMPADYLSRERSSILRSGFSTIYDLTAWNLSMLQRWPTPTTGCPRYGAYATCWASSTTIRPPCCARRWRESTQRASSTTESRFCGRVKSLQVTKLTLCGNEGQALPEAVSAIERKPSRWRNCPLVGMRLARCRAIRRSAPSGGSRRQRWRPSSRGKALGRGSPGGR